MSTLKNIILVLYVRDDMPSLIRKNQILKKFNIQFIDLKDFYFTLEDINGDNAAGVLLNRLDSVLFLGYAPKIIILDKNIDLDLEIIGFTEMFLKAVKKKEFNNFKGEVVVFGNDERENQRNSWNLLKLFEKE